MKDVYVSDNVEQGRNISKYMYIYIYTYQFVIYTCEYTNQRRRHREMPVMRRGNNYNFFVDTGDIFLFYYHTILPTLIISIVSIVILSRIQILLL